MKEKTAHREVRIPTDLLGRRPARHRLPAHRLGLVGTFPPTRCGIASFTAALATSLTDATGRQSSVLRLVDGEDEDLVRPAVAHTLAVDRPGWSERAVQFLQGLDAVVIQHEFGIFGPDSGWAVTDLIRGLRAPVVTTLHTVTPHLSSRERQILEVLAAESAFIVVLSESARTLLCDQYGVDPRWVEVIPHGTDLAPAEDLHGRAGVEGTEGSPLLLTWGLIGPGKGLDWGLESLRILRKSHPRARWTIAGQTHPKVVAHEGERYRRSLVTKSRHLLVEDGVTFIDRYLPKHHVHSLVRSADVVVLPYDSTEQTSSGVLIEAVRAGVPVVATRFPQAVELERKGAVVTVPHRDPAALAAAVGDLVSDSVRRAEMVSAQQEVAGEADWCQVARRYLHLVDRALTARVAL
jgi:polysaccharide biosynthesis protein PslF